MRSPATFSTTPSCLESTTTPESCAALYSMPVPTMGASGTSSGTAWRCMLEPIRARVASSFSRKGIMAVATETICRGLTSMRSTFSRGTRMISALSRTVTYSLTKEPSSLRDSLASATL